MNPPWRWACPGVWVENRSSGEPRVDAFAGAGSYGARELSAGVSGSSEGLSYAARTADPVPPSLNT